MDEATQQLPLVEVPHPAGGEEEPLAALGLARPDLAHDDRQYS